MTIELLQRHILFERQALEAVVVLHPPYRVLELAVVHLARQLLQVVLNKQGSASAGSCEDVSSGCNKS